MKQKNNMKHELLKYLLLIIIAAALVALTGCSSVQKMVPSFWDDNQSKVIIDVRQKVEQIDCKADQLPQVTKVRKKIRWFELYSESKGIRQHDVLAIVEPMAETVDAWIEHEHVKPNNEIFCTLKKEILQEQASMAATAILGRF